MSINERHCAFLRGVNVNGNRMKMQEVCNVFKSCGASDVTSVLATGNIIFKSQEETEILKIKLESALSKYFNYKAHIFIKTISEIENIYANSPFIKEENHHIYCFITLPFLEVELLEKFKKSKKLRFEKAEIVKQNFYWKVPKGETLNSDFGKILGNQSLKTSLTSRNINTIEKIIAKIN